MPAVVTIRPGDANEVVEAWRLTREITHEAGRVRALAPSDADARRSRYAPATGTRQGAYVFADPPGGESDVILMAGATEVSLVVAAHEQLVAEGSDRASSACRRASCSNASL
jgi:transketolase